MAANEWVKYAVVTGKNELAEGECGYGLSIFERETKYSRLVEALKLSQKWLANSVSVVPIGGPKPLPVIAELLAEIKEG